MVQSTPVQRFPPPYAHSHLCCVSLVYSWRQGLSQEREARVDAAMKTTRVQDPLEAHLSRFVYAGLQAAFEAALDASARTADSIGKQPRHQACLTAGSKYAPQ